MTCVKTGKQIHLSIKKAQKHLRRMREIWEVYNGKIYACIHCGGWHIGRQRKKAKKNKYAKSSRLYN